MTGFFDTLRGLGQAHEQHVQAITAAFRSPDLQSGRDLLAAYLQSLSDNALLGFRASLGLLTSQETNPQVQQALQWVAANLDGLRAGQFAAVTPQSLPARGLTLAQVTALVTPWAEWPAERVQAAFVQALQALDAQGRHELAAHLETLAQQVQWQIGQLQQQDDSGAWGSSVEDRIAYLQARISTGAPSPRAGAIAQQQGILQALLGLAQAARQWQPPTPTPTPTPTPASASAPAASSSSAPAAPRQAAAGAEAAPTEMLAQLQQQFEQAKADMDPARAAALSDFMARLGRQLAVDEAQDTAGEGRDLSLDERRADLQRRMANLSELREQAQDLREMQRHVRRPQQALPAGSRAAAIGPLLDALVDDVSGLRNTPLPAHRESEAAQLQELHESLIRGRARVRELAARDDDVLHYERDALRGAVHALRLHHRRGHLMLARPLWPGGAARVEPGSACFAGPAAVRALVDDACGHRQMALRAPTAPGVDPATAMWRAFQAASLAVLDLSDGAPQTYYQLGQAYALGTELLLLARRGTALPFDVAQAVLDYKDEADLRQRLPAALDAALYGVQTLGLSALMHHTLAQAERIGLQAVGAAHLPLLMKQLQASVGSPLDFRAALEQWLAQIGNSRLVLLHPRWPARYPELGDGSQRRCFVVMPFSHALVSTQTLYRELDAALQRSGAQVVRGDEALGQDIVASIWEETARASHVLVDLTGYNLNVCLELGMADAMGRDTLLFGAAGCAEQRFAAIDKRRIHGYGDDEASRAALRDQVLGFVRRAPTLA